MITTSSAELIKTLRALVEAYDHNQLVDHPSLDRNMSDIRAYLEASAGAAAQGVEAPALRKYQVTIGAGVRAYATITVEAPDEDVAWNEARTILYALQDSMGKMVEFEADYETLHDLELLEDLVDITDH